MPDQPKGCLFGWLSALFGGSRERQENLPEVRVNQYFFTEAEVNFYRVLQNVVGQRAVILAQVSLRQLLWLPGSNQSNPGKSVWENKLRARSVDFLLCDPRTLRPRVAIELDDATHHQPKRQQRDQDVEALLAASGLPLVRIPAARSYDTRVLAQTLGAYLPQ